MVWVPGGEFSMGSDEPDFRDARPWHQVYVDGFWMDKTDVTNVEFERFVKATGYTKVMNFSSNLSSLLFFLIGGNVLFVSGLTMGLGQLLGARIGSRMVVAKGVKFIRPIFISMVLAITAKLLYDIYLKAT